VQAPQLPNPSTFLANFSPDSRLLIIVSSETDPQIIDAKTGQISHFMIEFNHRWITAQFSLDSKWLITTSRDTAARTTITPGNYAARLWDLSWLALQEYELRRRVCTEILIGKAQEFTDDELSHLNLHGVSQTNPCLRHGPLHWQYYFRR
jgi:hypothetical protein